MDVVSTLEEYEELLKREEAVLVYLSHDACGVCHSLKPKVRELIEEEFPRIKMVYVNTVLAAELAAQIRVFTVPTVLVFFEGREFARHSRNLSIPAFREELARPYGFMFAE